MAENKAQAKKKGGFDHLFFARIIDKLLDSMKKVLTVKLLDFCIKWLRMLGHWGIYVASALAVLMGLIGAIRMENFMFFVSALVFVIVLLIIQYVAVNFLDADEKLIKNNPTTLSSSAFLDCVGLLAMLGGIVALLFNLYMAIKLPAFGPLLQGIAAFVVLELIALIALNPKTVEVGVAAGTSAGQECIGIVTFFMKKIVKVVPIIFGLGIIVYTVMGFIASFGLFGDNSGIAALKVKSAASMVAGFALVPFLAYLFFVLSYLVIDLCRAILSIPGKLNK